MAGLLLVRVLLAVAVWSASLPAGDSEIPAADADEQVMISLVAKTLDDAEAVDNLEHRANLDSVAAANAGDFEGGLAESYYAHAAMLFMQHYFNEAWYGFARAASLQPTNGVYLINLAATLLELEKPADAAAILETVVRWFPGLDAAWGNLGVAYLDQGKCKEALAALERALQLDSENALWNAALAEALGCLGQVEKAKTHRKLAWENGYPKKKKGGGGGDGDDDGEGEGDEEGEGQGKEGGEGQGKEGGEGQGKKGGEGQEKGGEAPGKNAKGGGAEGTAGAKQGAGDAGDSGTAGAGGHGGGGKSGQPSIPEEWVGHYEARHVRMTAGGPRAFGEGLATTIINVDVLACAKVFGMDIAKDGTLSGKGMLFYVFNGEASNPVAAMAGMFGALIYGGFASSIRDGADTREWAFSGRVWPDGRVVIEGLPEDDLQFYNMGEWDVIKPWSPLPPPDTGHMRGPFELTMTALEDGTVAVSADKWLELNDPLLQKLHYEAQIVKSDVPMRPKCQYIRKKKECPGTEYLKTKIAFGHNEAVVVETSSELVSGKVETTTKVGNPKVNVESTGKVNLELSHGLLTGSIKFNPVDGSYVVGVGVGVDTKSVLKNAPASIKEKVELIYDSRCGWGIRGTFSASYRKQSAGIEGAVFFSKGI